MNKNKIASLIVAVSATCIVVANSDKVYATEKINHNNKLEQRTQVKAVEKGQVINVSSNLRIRKCANTKSNVVGYLTNGTVFNIEGKDGHWFKINSNGKVGYVHGDYVKELNGNTLGGNSNSGNYDLDTSQAGKTGKVINVSTSLRLRNGASTNSSVIRTLRNGQTFKIKGKKGEWYYIEVNGTTGYVHKDYVQVLSNGGNNNTNNNNGNQDGSLDKSYNGKTGQIVNVSTNLRFRNEPNKNGAVLGYLLPNQKVSLKGKTSNGWFKISHNGKTGYVSNEYIKVVPSNGGSTGGNASGNEVNHGKYEKVLGIMKAQIGSPYIYGGSGEVITQNLLNTLKSRFPDHQARGFYDVHSRYLNGNYRAFDCSGLMQWCFRQVGISLGRTTWDQANNGVKVSLSNIKPGDLLFFSNMGHVGMYIGNGQWIESPNKGKTISISAVPWSRIGSARRVL